MSSASATLRAAADLIERTGWTQRAGARDANGMWLPASSDDAVCFCALGALVRVGGIGGAFFAEVALAERVGLVPLWNDRYHRTAAEVIATMRRVAAEIEGSEGR